MVTSVQLPVCVYCGTARPADHSRCPVCGRTWIDIRVGADRRIPVAAAVGGSIETDPRNPTATVAPAHGDEDAEVQDTFAEDWDPWTTSGTASRDRLRWLVPGILATAVVVVYGLIFLGFLDEPGESAPDEAVPTTQAAPATTAPPDTTVPPTTTAAPPTSTTTTTTATTTTIAFGSLFEAAGQPIPLADLTLAASAVGPIQVGTSDAEAAGRLIATLGAPESSGAAGTDLGLCEEDSGFWLMWGQLTAVFSGAPGEATFASYRYAVPDGPATAHLDLATLSGLRLGDSIGTLQSVYSQYTIRYDTLDGADHFFLLEGDQLLLWGPISSPEATGRINGIHSPDACPSA